METNNKPTPQHEESAGLKKTWSTPEVKLISKNTIESGHVHTPSPEGGSTFYLS